MTFELLENAANGGPSRLRTITAAEVHAEALVDEPSAAESRDETVNEENGVIGLEQNAEEILQNNRLTIDDSSRQALSSKDIEELKKHAMGGSGKDIVAKILESHSAIGEKTAFSLAKYLLRKTKKYMKRFTVLPLDVSLLARWMLHERDNAKIMDLREETLGLMMSWSNVHYTNPSAPGSGSVMDGSTGRGRWLVVDDTAGLVVASMAERMGILHSEPHDDEEKDIANHNEEVPVDDMVPDDRIEDQEPPRKKRKPRQDSTLAKDNTITMIHSAAQPNLSLLAYFNYDPNASPSTPSATSIPDQAHPMHNHLHTLSWLQLLSPSEDSTYIEPTPLSDTELLSLKANKRGAYHRKRRRWERTKTVVDDTRAGGFDGLVIATVMEPLGVLHHLVPLLRGGAPVVVYSPTSEPLVEVMDAYSSSRKTTFIQLLQGSEDTEDRDENSEAAAPSDDFPVDPRLLLAPSLQTVRAKEWQVLPGRTHPLMTSRGGAEGYLFTATRVLPTEGRVEARGKFSKRRKVGAGASASGSGGGNGVTAAAAAAATLEDGEGRVDQEQGESVNGAPSTTET